MSDAHPDYHEWRRGDASVSTDPTRLDLAVVHGFLTQAYWSPGVALETVRRSIAHSIPFGVYLEGRQLEQAEQAEQAPQAEQVGFARVISDWTTFAYLSDVFILPAARGQGLARFLLDCILAHPDLQDLRTWALFTRDAQGLYEQVGFERGKLLERLMVRRDS